jgi:CP family cyanate transporter-like MFS transporter
MSQSFGYLMAGAGPVLFGWFHGLSGDWALPLLVLFVGAAVQFIAGVALLRGRLALSAH